jgi:hypothetical protein
LFLPIDVSPTLEDTNSNPPITPTAEEQTKSIHVSPMAITTRQTTRSRSLLKIEEEHDQLLKSLIDNRTRLNQLLHSSNI